jgi:hypothetical protein
MIVLLPQKEPIAGHSRDRQESSQQAQAEVKAAYWQIFDDIIAPCGQAAVDEPTRAEAVSWRTGFLIT